MPPTSAQQALDAGPLLTSRDLLETFPFALVLAGVVVGAVSFVLASPVLACGLALTCLSTPSIPGRPHEL